MLLEANTLVGISYGSSKKQICIVELLSCFQFFVIPRTVAHQASLSM